MAALAHPGIVRVLDVKPANVLPAHPLGQRLPAPLLDDVSRFMCSQPQIGCFCERHLFAHGVPFRTEELIGFCRGVILMCPDLADVMVAERRLDLRQVRQA